MSIASRLRELSGDIQPVLDCAGELIRRPSLSGQEDEVVAFLHQEAERLGFDAVYEDGAGNFIARLDIGPGDGRKIVLSGHLDTVNADPAGWPAAHQPFQPVLENGRLYGRGASDMKGALATMLHAAARCRRLADAGHRGQLFVVGTVVEELFEGVCFAEALEAIAPDWVIIGEASRCRLNVGQRGRAEVSVTVPGIPAHAAQGRNTINPIEQAAVVLDTFHTCYRCQEDALLGGRIIVPTDIQIPVGGGGGLDGRGGNSTVPSRVQITYDVRTLPGDTAESILALMDGELEQMRRAGRLQEPPGRRVEFTVASDSARTRTGRELRRPKFAPAWRTADDTPLLAELLGALGAVGLDARPGAYSFCTDGSALVEYRARHPERDCQVVGFGPSGEELAHVVDEYVEVSELERALLGYLALCERLLRP